MSGPIVGDHVRLIVCKCGVVAVRHGTARCGRDARTNLKASCPAYWVMAKVESIEKR